MTIHKLTSITILTILSLTLIIPIPSEMSCQAGDIPVSIPSRETCTYHLSWNGLLAVGRAAIRLEKDNDLIRLEMTARTVRPIDFLFKIRDRFDSELPTGLFYFLQYRKRIREGHYRRLDLVTYNPSTNMVTYKRNGKLRDKMKVAPPLYDPFSVLYAYRFRCDPSRQCTLVATDGKHVDKVTVRPLKKEKIKVPAGTFDTIKVEPCWKRMQGVFRTKKGGHIYVWFTDDRFRVPVKMEAEIFLGRVVGELTQRKNTEQED